MVEIIDKGHAYKLLSLDGEHEQELRFVKRYDPTDFDRYPGNENEYPGTTIQSVLRALLERMRYLQHQVWSGENIVVISCLRVALWFMEFRAARRHGRFYAKSLSYAEFHPMCKTCGHTLCEHKS